MRSGLHQVGDVNCAELWPSDFTMSSFSDVFPYRITEAIAALRNYGEKYAEVNRAFSAEVRYYTNPMALPQAEIEGRAFGAKHPRRDSAE